MSRVKMLCSCGVPVPVACRRFLNERGNVLVELHLTAGLQVSLKCEHGLDARPGAQERVAYRQKKKGEEFGDVDEKQSNGAPACVFVCMCTCLCGCDGGSEAISWTPRQSLLVVVGRFVST